MSDPTSPRRMRPSMRQERQEVGTDQDQVIESDGGGVNQTESDGSSRPKPMIVISPPIISPTGGSSSSSSSIIPAPPLNSQLSPRGASVGRMSFNSGGTDLPLHMQYAAAAEASAARQSLRSSGRGAALLAGILNGGSGGSGSGSGSSLDPDSLRHGPRTSMRRGSHGGGMISSSWNTGGGSGSSHHSSYLAHSSYNHPTVAHPGAASALPTTLHPSAAQLTPLPNFSHESLGAYQLKLDPSFVSDIYSLRHNVTLGVHQKTAMCLSALERLANDCIVHHSGGGDTSPQRTNETQAAIMALLAPKGVNQEEQLDGIPLSQHHTALKTTILNLRSMLIPLLVAPRGLFQTSLNQAEETAVKYGAITYETEIDRSADSDSVRLGPDGEMIRRGQQAPIGHEAIRREEERKLKEDKLAKVEQLLRAHEGGGGSHRNSVIGVNNGATEEKQDGDQPDADDVEAAENLLKKPKMNYKFLFSRDEESGLDPATVPYYEVIQNFQYMKNVLSKKLLAMESSYLERMTQLYSSQEEISYLKEVNRAKDLKCAATTRVDMRLHDEFTALREKLNENYQELKKLRSKNAEMKQNMKKLSKSSGTTPDKKDVNSKHAPSSNKEAKKLFEDLVMSLKEKNDEIIKFTKTIQQSNAEKDNLTTQVEILEQAVQTMRYMIKDILKKINENEVTLNQGIGGLKNLNPKYLRAEGAVVVQGGSNLSAKNMIACRGIGKNVPKFLAYSGWVRRYDLGKRHTELIIKEIWSLKTIADETRRKSGLKRTTLQDFFQKYLKSRFPLATDENLHKKMEFTYNFVEACEKYRADHDMDLFFKILFHQCSEERYIDQMTMMAHFKKCLTQMDIVDGIRDGFIHKMVFFAGLRQFFPVKSEENSRALIEIVLREMQTKSSKDPNDVEMSVDISKLMAETSDGDESTFMNAIRNQYEEEVNAFPIQIAAALHKASRQVFGGGNLGFNSYGNNSYSSSYKQHLRTLSYGAGVNPNDIGEGWLPAGQIASILQDLDPAKPKHEIETYMRRGLNLDGYFRDNNLTQMRENQKELALAAAAAAANNATKHQSVANSRASTPGHNPSLSSPSNAILTERKDGGAPGTPQKSDNSASGVPLLRKTSINSFNSPTNSLPGAQHQRGGSFTSGGGGSTASLLTPGHDRTQSGTSGTISPGSLGVPITSRAVSRMSVGNGLNIVTSSGASGTSSTSPSTPSHGGVVTGGSNEKTASPHLDRTPSISGAPTPQPTQAAPGAQSSSRPSREHSRRSSDLRGIIGDGSLPRASSVNQTHPTHPSNTSISNFTFNHNNSSYDPCLFVELGPFLERLNTLFLHRTGHYNSELDIPGLGKLIKDELERQADEERKMRDLIAAKKGLGTGLQVNSLNLPNWSTLFANYKRQRDNPHIRDEILAKLILKYSLPEDDPQSQELVDPQTNEVKRVRMPVELEREGSDEESPLVTIKYRVDPLLNHVVTCYRGDATKLQIDAIVNAANPQLVAGGGICAAIFQGAGHHSLSKACAKLNGCAYGHTKITSGFKLPAKYILHSVSPVDNKDATALASCYTTILDLCLQREIKSVAMCCLATGIYGFKHVDAAEIALRTIREWLDRDELHRKALDRIVFSVFSEEDANIYNNLLPIFFPCPPVDKSRPVTSVSANPEASLDSSVHLPPGHSKRSSLVRIGPEDGDDLTDGLGSPKRTISFSSESKENHHEKPTNHRKKSMRLSQAEIATVNAPEPPVVTQPLPPPPNPFQHSPGKHLSKFRYELPKGLNAPTAPTPKTVSQMFEGSTVAVSPSPPRTANGVKDYQANKSGEQQSTSDPTTLPLIPTAPVHPQSFSERARSGKYAHQGRSLSLHGLAKLVRFSVLKFDEDEDD